MLAGGISEIAVETTHGQGFTTVTFRRRMWWKSALAFVGFLAVWLFGGAFAALMLLATAADQPLFFIVWLALWGICGLVTLLAIMWRAFGVESLTARADGLTLIRRLLLLKVPVTVPARQITAITWIPDDPNRVVKINGRRIPQTAIQIAAGSTHLRCARGIGEAEAQSVIDTLKQRLVVSWKRRS